MATRKADFWKALQEAKLQVKRGEEEADLRRDMFQTQVLPTKKPDISYEPTQSSNPDDPRTAAMQYWQDAQVMRVEWGDGGTPYLYYEVTKEEASRFADVKSPGRFINRVLNGKPYGPEY
jgi:KTSC domain-containing protein